MTYIDLYEDSRCIRRVRCDKIDRKFATVKDKAVLRRKLYEEILIAVKRNPEKKYWMELKTNNL